MSLNINQTTDKITPTTGTLDVVGAFTVNGAAPGGGPTFIVLGSDSTTTSSTFSNVTGLSFTAEANKTYLVDLMGIVQASGANANPLFVLDVPDGTVTGFNLFGGIGQVYAAVNDQNSDDAVVAVQPIGLRTTATNYPLQARWVYNAGGSGGTVRLRIRSRVNDVGTARLVAGSVMQWQKVN